MIGKSIGPYQIVAELGRGGMGEVYRATDTRLKRQVAIKILPSSVAADHDRLARFQREAEVLASLNHPNIAGIYGLEESGGVSALVMELVEGEDLSALIADTQPEAESGSSSLRKSASAERRGGGAPRSLSIDDCLRIAKQLAEALEAAHERGIIHRDLKPANIKVRADGTVKVLDFGLAKALEPPGAVPGSVSMSPTITSPAMTQAGMILGTAAYMSPEQARGKLVDKRADIWAFGCVLFEMLTGTRAFPGDDVTDTLAAVVRAEPEWSLLPPHVSPTLLMFLRRCLQKDLRQRVADIHDVRLALDGAFDAVSAPVADVATLRPRARERIAWAAALGVVGLATIGLAVAAFRDETPAVFRPMRFSIPPPDNWSLTTDLMPGGASPAPLAISPDGTRIAFVANPVNGPTRLWLRPMDALSAQELPGTSGAGSPFWSPDSRFVAFFADGKLKKIDVSGGPPVTLCSSPGNVGGTWNRDGVIVFGPSTNTALQKVSDSGGVPAPATVLGPGENYHGRPSFLPDGRHFLYRVGNGAIYLASLDSATERTVLFKSSDSTNVVYANGYLLYLRETTLMAQPFDADRLVLTGNPSPIAEQVMATANNPNGFFSASATGVLIYQSGAVSVPERQLTWFDRSGKALASVEKPGLYNTVALSPDDTRVAVSRGSSRSTVTNNIDVWVDEFARSASTRFTFAPQQDWLSVWSPDGSRIAWARGGGIYQKASNGAGADELLLERTGGVFPYDWSPDGKFLVYGDPSGSFMTLWTLPMTASDRTPRRYLEEPGSNATQARFSPDGRFVIYTSNVSGIPEVYVRPFPDADGGRWMVSQGGGSQPQWRNDGKELFYLARDARIMAVPIATEPAFTAGVPKALFAAPIWGGGGTLNVTRYDVTHDGQRFLVNVLMDKEKPEPLGPITVVLNWPAGLKP